MQTLQELLSWLLPNLWYFLIFYQDYCAEKIKFAILPKHSLMNVPRLDFLLTTSIFDFDCRGYFYNGMTQIKRQKLVVEVEATSSEEKERIIWKKFNEILLTLAAKISKKGVYCLSAAAKL